MYYTQRRGSGIALIHGTNIGMAASDDNGATWKYLGTADITYGQDQHPDDYTYWAPEVIWVTDIYHMYLTFVPGIFNDWNHPREIVHLTSKDGIKWDTVGKLDLKSGKAIDPCVIQLPDGNWRMFYKDEEKPDPLLCRQPRPLQVGSQGQRRHRPQRRRPQVLSLAGQILAHRRHTGPRAGRLVSDDCTHWKPQDGVLFGNHGDVVVSGDRAWWFYFGGQTAAMPTSTGPSSPATQPAATPTTHLPRPPLLPSRPRRARRRRPSTSSSSKSLTAN